MRCVFFVLILTHCVVTNNPFILSEEATDGASMESSVCAGCLNVLDEEEFIQALNQEWHMECFRCFSLNYCLLLMTYACEYSVLVWLLAGTATACYFSFFMCAADFKGKLVRELWKCSLKET
jgi:hypothetical protein